MFRFDAFHMYGIIGLAVIVAMGSIQLIKKLSLQDSKGNKITVPSKDPSQVTRYLLGGTLFGFGWALTGACPGPCCLHWRVRDTALCLCPLPALFWGRGCMVHCDRSYPIRMFLLVERYLRNEKKIKINKHRELVCISNRFSTKN
ncbi:MAG: hypothetical protein U5J63_03625 [Fodinibius sp.]|nr:hypothetical protein [Fodinibius sp.]